MTSELCSTCSKPLRMSEAMQTQFETLHSVTPQKMVRDGGIFHDDPLYVDPIWEWEGKYRFDIGLCVCDWD